MKMIPNAGRVAKRALSMQFLYAASAVQAAALALPFFAKGLDLDPLWTAGLTLVLNFGAILGRLIIQSGVE